MTNVTSMPRPFRLVAAFGLCTALAACGGPKFKSDYSVAVTFTPAAAAALKAANESVILDAYYYGAPTEAAKTKANEAGQIELGQDLVPVDPAVPTVHVAGHGIDQEYLIAIEGKVSVELRAYSGTDRDNLLKCATVTTTLGDLQAKPPALTCDAA